MPRFHRAARRRPLFLAAAVAAAALLLPLNDGGPASAAAAHKNQPPKPTIVLVHGAWADGSSWSGVATRLQKHGYTVVAPPNTLRSPSQDAAYLASFLATIPGPIVLVGHSYGGFVITNAATGNTNVKALVYVDAFIPDAGDTVLDLDAGSCLGGDPAKTFNAVPFSAGVDLYIQPQANDGFAGFDGCFANGVDPKQAAVLAAVQRPITLAAFTEPSGPPAWAGIRSWAVVGTEDRVITPAQQRSMATHAGSTIVPVKAGHLSLISRDDKVAGVVEDAATS